jgi:hypothetical protein
MKVTTHLQLVPKLGMNEAVPLFLHISTWHAQRQLYYPNVRTFSSRINPYPTAFPYGNGMVLHFYQQEESSTTKTVNKVINKGLKTYV